MYGRPRLGLTEDVGADDVAAVRARQRELGVREAFEWVHETTPSHGRRGGGGRAGRHARPAARARCRRRWAPPPAPAGMTVRLLAPDDPALPAAQGVVELAFAAAATGLGDAGPEERAVAARAVGDLGFLRERLRRRLTVMAVAEDANGPVAAGSHQPVERRDGGHGRRHAALRAPPRRRRRRDRPARRGRARTAARRSVFLSAADDDVARLYGRLGFRPLGTACFGRPADA